MSLKLTMPRCEYEFETYRQLREGGQWIGCNHCGRTVPDDGTRIAYEGPLYHRYCYLKLFRRNYAMLLYGVDVFKDDAWEKWFESRGLSNREYDWRPSDAD
jgi:hypothetical protein